jgi:hypothetical protein
MGDPQVIMGFNTKYRSLMTWNIWATPHDFGNLEKIQLIVPLKEVVSITLSPQLMEYPMSCIGEPRSNRI